MKQILLGLVALCSCTLLSSCDDAASSAPSVNPPPAEEIVDSTPRFSPPGGSYSGTQSVAIISDIEGLPIYYSKDGSFPSTTRSFLYTGPVTVNANVTLIAVVLKNGRAVGEVGMATYKIAGSSSSTDIPWKTGPTYGTLTDARDGWTYRTVVIGSQTWMAENLSYWADSSWWVGGNVDTGAKYGRLYAWTAAMDLPASCEAATCSTKVQAKHRGVCPEGWHLPTTAEWDALLAYAGGNAVAGAKLKATKGWSAKYTATDDFGFRALPTGYRPRNGGSEGFGLGVAYWTAKERDPTYAWNRDLGATQAIAYIEEKTTAYPVRCIKD